MDNQPDIEKVVIQRITGDGREEMEDTVTREVPVTIMLNNEELITLLCTPVALKYLAAGYLASEGFIKTRDDIKSIIVDEARGIVRIETKAENTLAKESFARRMITTGCGKGATFYAVTDVQDIIKVETETTVKASDIFSLMKETQQRSEVYRNTHGIHHAALCKAGSISIFHEDIGRHNAIDKIIGQCLIEYISTDDCMIITSGRISSEILLKIAKRNVPILASKSAPTNLGVKLANQLGITLIGFVRGQRMNCYANDWRIVSS